MKIIMGFSVFSSWIWIDCFILFIFMYVDTWIPFSVSIFPFHSVPRQTGIYHLVKIRFIKSLQSVFLVYHNFSYSALEFKNAELFTPHLIHKLYPLHLIARFKFLCNPHIGFHHLLRGKYNYRFFLQKSKTNYPPKNSSRVLNTYYNSPNIFSNISWQRLF